MATTTFKYASHRDLKDIFPEVDRYDTKRVLRDWTKEHDAFPDADGDLWYSYNTGLITELFVNGGKIVKGTFPTSAAATVDTFADGSASFTINETLTDQITSDILKIDNQYVKVSSIDYETKVISMATESWRNLFQTNEAAHTNGTNVYIVWDASALGIEPDVYSFVYDSDLDLCILAVPDGIDPNDDIMVESGEDTSTLINRLLVNGAMELNSMLDARFPIPIPPTFQYSSDPSSDTAEYDYVLKRANALITASHLAQTRDIELAESYYRQITNAENTGIIDRINDGRVKLSFERVENDSEGRIIEITKAGTMSMVELSGDWTGDKYDRVQVICTTGGGYGTAQVTVYSYDGTNLYGNSSAPITITGGMDYLINGISGRFEGNSLSLNDRWDFEVRRDSITNPQTGSIELCR